MSPRELPVRIDLANGLLEADARLPVSLVGRACQRLGLWFPLARPLPGFSLAEACARLPVFADAFVAQAEGRSSGAHFSTPRAPRSAVGPDLLGGLALKAPLAEVERVRLRVFDVTRTASSVESYETSAAAAARVVALVLEGRAFSLEARKEEGRVHLHLLAGVGIAPATSTPPRRPFAHAPDARVASSVSLVPGDTIAIAAALDDGARVFASPYMGRVGALLPTRTKIARLPIGAACEQLARALTPSERTHVQ